MYWQSQYLDHNRSRYGSVNCDCWFFNGSLKASNRAGKLLQSLELRSMKEHELHATPVQYLELLRSMSQKEYRRREEPYHRARTKFEVARST